MKCGVLGACVGWWVGVGGCCGCCCGGALCCHDGSLAVLWNGGATNGMAGLCGGCGMCRWIGDGGGGPEPGPRR